jgi:hypothetical protein
MTPADAGCQVAKGEPAPGYCGRREPAEEWPPPLDRPELPPDERAGAPPELLPPELLRGA